MRWLRPAPGRGAGVAFALALAMPAAAGAVTWSAPAALTACPGASLPRVVFPNLDPHTSGGSGAILWSGDPVSCAQAASARRTGTAPAPAPTGVGEAVIGADDIAGPARALPIGPGPSTVLDGLGATAATGDGRIVLSTGVDTRQSGVLEGRADGRFTRPLPIGARTALVATATSYLGDVALATLSTHGRLVLRIQRHGVPGLTAPVVISAAPQAVTAVAVGLDYRGDALVVWAQAGWIRNRVVRPDGRLLGPERIAPSGATPHLQALISDDNRGIVAFTRDEPAGASTTTGVYLGASRSGVHFPAPRLLERFTNPPGLHLPEGSLRLVRLAGEGVMVAWTGIAKGRYAVRAASVSLDGLHPVTTVSAPGDDAVLADLATGPRDEVIAVWSSAPRTAGALDLRQAEVLGSHGVAQSPGVATFSSPELVAGPGAIFAPRVAIDSASDAAVAVWQRLGGGIEYAVRAPAAAPAQAGAAAARAPTRHPDAVWRPWISISLIAVALAAVLAGGILHAAGQPAGRYARAADSRGGPFPFFRRRDRSRKG